ncbi:MAG TPA: protein phosphatase 2C domain-containing protein [Pseudonocardiaceae bacterium]|jgi:protein phosphatase|nr:protein phosphatase 2C domain-containing protein [Pseudonocardiaceae bacterium]
MLTAPIPVAQPLRWDAVSRPGLRRVNADATAVHHNPATGRTAFVIADGIGDNESAAHAAQLAARTAAEAAAAGRSPVEAVLAAQRAVLGSDTGRNTSGDTGSDIGGDTVLAIAVPSGNSCEVAWVGDCRVYQWNGRVLEQITTDHTAAEYFRSRGLRPAPQLEHMVTTSVRTVVPDRIGHARTSLRPGRLLLCSDGVHKPLPVGELRDLLDRPAEPAQVAGFLVAGALRFGGTDNATALVVDHQLSSETDVAA